MNTISILSVLERTTDFVAARFEKPDPSEHDPYYSRYIDRVPPGDFPGFLRRQVDDVVDLFGACSSEQADFAYAPGKWTIKEILGHLIDTERVFGFRAASIGRRDPAPLPNFDQDAWAAHANYTRRPIDRLLAEWLVVRASTLTLVEGLPADAPALRGVAAGNEVSVRALLYVPPGHVNYHIEIIRDRYAGAGTWPQ